MSLEKRWCELVNQISNPPDNMDTLAISLPLCGSTRSQFECQLIQTTNIAVNNVCEVPPNFLEDEYEPIAGPSRMFARQEGIKMKRLCVEEKWIELERQKEKNRAKEQEEARNAMERKDEIIMKLLSSKDH